MLTVESISSAIYTVPRDSEIMVSSATLVDMLSVLVTEDCLNPDNITRKGNYWQIYGRTMVVDNDIEYGTVSAVIDLKIESV